MIERVSGVKMSDKLKIYFGNLLYLEDHIELRDFIVKRRETMKP